MVLGSDVIMAELDQFSRFNGSEQTIFDGVETYGYWNAQSFLIKRPTEDLIGIFRVLPAVEGRPDLISNQLYGTPLLDWVLIAFNNVTDLNWPRAGDVVEYPNKQLVIREVVG